MFTNGPIVVRDETNSKSAWLRRYHSANLPKTVSHYLPNDDYFNDFKSGNFWGRMRSLLMFERKIVTNQKCVYQRTTNRSFKMSLYKNINSKIKMHQSGIQSNPSIWTRWYDIFQRKWCGSFIFVINSMHCFFGSVWIPPSHFSKRFSILFWYFLMYVSHISINKHIVRIKMNRII